MGGEQEQEEGNPDGRRCVRSVLGSGGPGLPIQGGLVGAVDNPRLPFEFPGRSAEHLLTSRQRRGCGGNVACAARGAVCARLSDVRWASSYDHSGNGGSRTCDETLPATAPASSGQRPSGGLRAA